MCAALLFTATACMAESMLTLKDIAGSEFSAERLSAITPLADGESYAMISKDGKKVVKYSFKTGKQAAVLFDADNTIGEKVKKVENFIMSPDGTRMLIQTESKKYIAAHSQPHIIFILLTTGNWNACLTMVHNNHPFGLPTV